MKVDPVSIKIVLMRLVIVYAVQHSPYLKQNNIHVPLPSGDFSRKSRHYIFVGPVTTQGLPRKQHVFCPSNTGNKKSA